MSWLNNQQNPFGSCPVRAANRFRMMVARDGVEPPTPAFSGLRSLSLAVFSINNLTCQSGQIIVTIL